MNTDSLAENIYSLTGSCCFAMDPGERAVEWWGRLAEATAPGRNDCGRLGEPSLSSVTDALRCFRNSIWSVTFCEATSKMRTVLRRFLHQEEHSAASRNQSKDGGGEGRRCQR